MYQNDTYEKENLPKIFFFTENLPLFVISFCYDIR